MTREEWIAVAEEVKAALAKHEKRYGPIVAPPESIDWRDRERLTGELAQRIERLNRSRMRLHRRCSDRACRRARQSTGETCLALQTGSIDAVTCRRARKCLGNACSAPIVDAAPVASRRRQRHRHRHASTRERAATIASAAHRVHDRAQET